VTIFDGVTDKLVNGDVLVKDNLIEQISSEPLSVIATTNTTTIDGGGRTLMPGLIESHVHLTLQHMIGGALAALTGKNNPSPNKLGVIEEGAYADILLVEGNPLKDITVIGGNPKLFDAPDRKAGSIETIRLIMKDGKIYKNTL